MAKIPEMTREEEAEFWKTHSSVDYLDDMEPVEVEFHPNIKNSRDLSRRCPVCDDVLLFRYANRDAAGGRVTLHRLMEFYCRQGHGVWLAPEAAKELRAIEAVLDLRAVEPVLVEELVAA
ncbi:MAG: hypothetical protein FJ011_13865 [Chloroflexi bacterium]|nr:hypothetical protein [Chloroflexota bacterium]